MHYGHWARVRIMGEDGKRWHPCRSQDELLAELSTLLFVKNGEQMALSPLSVEGAFGGYGWRLFH